MNAVEFAKAASNLIVLDKKYKSKQAILEARIQRQAKFACKIHKIAQSLEPALRALGEGGMLVFHDYWFSLRDGLVFYDQIHSYLDIPDTRSMPEGPLTEEQIDEAAAYAARLADRAIEKAENQLRSQGERMSPTDITSPSIIPSQRISEVRARNNLISEEYTVSCEGNDWFIDGPNEYWELFNDELSARRRARTLNGHDMISPSVWPPPKQTASGPSDVQNEGA